MDQKIRELDDATALRVITSFARARLHGGDCQQQWSPEIAEALGSVAGQTTAEPAVSEGDLAREALLLLAEDRQNHHVLTSLIDGPSPERLSVTGTIAAVTAALVVLQTRVKFQLKEGKLSLEILKPTMDTELLKSLAHKLLTFVTTGGRIP